MKEFKKILMSLAVMVMAVFGMSVSVWAGGIDVSAEQDGIVLKKIISDTQNAEYSVSYSDGNIGEDDVLKVRVDDEGKWSSSLPSGDVIETVANIKKKLKALDDDTQESISTSLITVTATNIANETDTISEYIPAKQFTVKKFPITAEAEDRVGGTVTVTPAKAKGYFEEDTVDITAKPEPDSDFVINYWEINGEKKQAGPSEYTKQYKIESSNTVKVGFGKVILKDNYSTTVYDGDELNIAASTSGFKHDEQKEGGYIKKNVNCCLEGSRIKLMNPDKDGTFIYVYEFGNASATSAPITVKSKSKPITKITLSGNNTVEVGEIIKVYAEIQPLDATEQIEWHIESKSDMYSRDEKVTNPLSLTAMKPGIITITANVKNRTTCASDPMTITIKEPSPTISVTPSSAIIGKGKKLEIEAKTTSKDADAANVTWEIESGSENIKICKGKEKGRKTVIEGVKATSDGELAVVKATLDGSTARAYITVVNGTPITKFTLEDVKVTVGFEVPVKATITPKGATYKEINWEWNGDSIQLKDKVGITSGVAVRGKSTVSNLKLKATIEDEIFGNSTAECTVTVYSTPTLKYDSSEGKLTATLPSQVYTGSDDSVNLKSVKGGYLIASYGGNEVWNSGDKYKGSGTSFTVSNSDLQGIVDSIKDKLSGSTATINFKLYPVGESVSGDGSKRNSDVAASQDVTAYQVKVYGENITAATYYGIPKASVKITATPITGYSFSKWSDGSTSNPRTVEVSSSESSNSYQAVAVAGVKTAAGQGKAGADGYDRVPRTGEGSEVIVLWIVLILTAIGGFIAYRKLRPQPVVNKDETSKDSKK